MMNKVNCIMLVDDNEDDNFFHERVIRKYDAADKIVVKESGDYALEYLKNRDQHQDSHPDIIFLDINMPRMNGWEFIEEYKKLDEKLRSKMVVVMLTTSENPYDKAKAKMLGLSTLKTKPLTKEILENVLNEFHKECINE